MSQNSYPPALAELLHQPRLSPLGPGQPNKEAYAQLKALSVETAFSSETVRDRSMAACCLAGLWLYHDYLEESHQISQAISSSTGSYWHGIMHRREPDFGNSAYWFRRVGTHSVFEPLCQAAAEIAQKTDLDSSAQFLVKQSQWNPFAFIDLCEGAYRKRNDHEMLCRQIQQKEWELLFQYCYRQAIGADS